jgi:hypothetical protein
MRHCIETICSIVAQNRSDRRSLLQLGYNLGRLSEMTGLGRKPFWDRWKEAVADWDQEALKALAQELQELLPDGEPSLDNDPNHPIQ